MGLGSILNNVVSKAKALNPIPTLVSKAKQATSQISSYAKATPSPKQVLNQVEKNLKPVVQSVQKGLDQAQELAHQAADKTKELVHDGVELATKVKDEVDRVLGPIDLAKTAMGLGKMAGGGALAYGSIVSGLGLCAGSEVGGVVAALPSGGTSVVGAQFACGAGLGIAVAGSATGYSMMMSGVEDLKNSKKSEDAKSKSHSSGRTEGQSLREQAKSLEEKRIAEKLPEDIQNWKAEPTRSGKGNRIVDPQNPHRQVRIMDPVSHPEATAAKSAEGGYIRINDSGKISEPIPLTRSQREFLEKTLHLH